MTPPVECSGWTKPAASGNQYTSPDLLLKSNFPFFNLPPELRLMIYSDLIKSGNLEVLRLCQKTHNEAIEFVSRDGIYRVKTKEDADFYFGYSPEAYNERNRIRKEIQNVEIHTDLKNVTSLKMWNPVPRSTKMNFIPPTISGKNCWIHLTHHDMTTETDLNVRLAIMIRAVQQFDNVFVHLPRTDQSKQVAQWILDKYRADATSPPIWSNDPDPAKRCLMCAIARDVQEGF